MTTMVTDPSGRGPSMRSLAITGVATVVALCALLFLLGLRYTGYFDRTVGVDALLTSTGDGLPANADVKYRGVIVGRVTGVDVTAKGETQRVQMELDPERAQGIPRDVRARVIPSNIFGLTAIEFVGAQDADGGALRAGDTVREDHSSATIQLQTTFTTLRDVLAHIQPEKLGRVLGTLAEALDPTARVEGSTIDRLQRWLEGMDAAIPDLGKLLGDFGAATAGLSQSAPDLFDVLADSVVASTTLTERRSGLVALLTTAGGTVDSVNSLFARNPDAGKDLAIGVDELFGAFADDPDALPETAANLNVALRNLATTFAWGPKRQMIWQMDVSFTPFQQYTAADCPQYGEMHGPRCGGPTVPAVAPPQDYPSALLPASLRGPAAVAEIVGGQPSASELLLLLPALIGGSVTATEGDN